MTIDLKKLEDALSYEYDARSYSEYSLIDKAAREYLAIQKALPEDCQEALDSLNKCAYDYVDEETGERMQGVHYGIEGLNMLRAALQSTPPKGWKPIETAPKDKDVILLIKNGDDFQHVVACYEDGTWSTRPYLEDSYTCKEYLYWTGVKIIGWTPLIVPAPNPEDMK